MCLCFCLLFKGVWVWLTCVMKRMSLPTFGRTANHSMSTYTTSTTNSKRRRTSGRTWVIQYKPTHKHIFYKLTSVYMYVFWLLCVGLGSLEESETKCFSRSDQKGRGEEDDGETNDNGWRIRLSQKEHQNIQRNSRREVRHIEIFTPYRFRFSRLWGFSEYDAHFGIEVQWKGNCLVKSCFRIYQDCLIY